MGFHPQEWEMKKCSPNLGACFTPDRACIGTYRGGRGPGRRDSMRVLPRVPLAALPPCPVLGGREQASAGVGRGRVERGAQLPEALGEVEASGPYPTCTLCPAISRQPPSSRVCNLLHGTHCRSHISCFPHSQHASRTASYPRTRVSCPTLSNTPRSLIPTWFMEETGQIRFNPSFSLCFSWGRGASIPSRLW